MPSVSDQITIDTPKIACNGDQDSSHPRVFLTIGKDGRVECPYCSKIYVLRTGAATHSH